MACVLAGLPYNSIDGPSCTIPLRDLGFCYAAISLACRFDPHTGCFTVNLDVFR